VKHQRSVQVHQLNLNSKHQWNR